MCTPWISRVCTTQGIFDMQIIGPLWKPAKSETLWIWDLEICALSSPPDDGDPCLKTVDPPGVPAMCSTGCTSNVPVTSATNPRRKSFTNLNPPLDVMPRFERAFVECSRMLYGCGNTARFSHAEEPWEAVSSSAPGYCLTILLPIKLLAFLCRMN